MTPRPLLLAVPLLLGTLTAVFAQTPSSPPPDPSGTWRSEIGELSTMLAGGALSFSYGAVFGPTAHLCDGAGVAGLDGPARWVWTDDVGTVEFVAADDGLRMRVTDGVVSFCGAGWAGDTFPLARHHPPSPCTVAAERSLFHVVDPLAHDRRRGYVVRGDRVESVPAHNLDLEGFVLARFVGPGTTTAGLLRRADLTCREP